MLCMGWLHMGKIESDNQRVLIQDYRPGNLIYFSLLTALSDILFAVNCRPLPTAYQRIECHYSQLVPGFHANESFTTGG